MQPQRVKSHLVRTVAGITVLSVTWILVLNGCSSDSTPTAPVETVAPTANFVATTDAANPLMVVFTDTSDKGSAAITAWAWDFGDVNAGPKVRRVPVQ